MIREDLRFDVQPEVVAWLEANIVLPPEMSPKSPGPFRTHKRPFMRPVLECWHPNSGVRQCTFTGAAQDAGKTTALTLGAGYRIAHSPMPMMLMGPTERWTIEKLVTERMHPLINANRLLSIHKPFNSDLFKNQFMAMSGGAINVVGANSSTSLAGGTKGIVAIDEAAKIEHVTREDAPEAHPILNALERTKEFRGIDFQWMSGTPNTAHHIFWTTYLAGDQTLMYVPCPHCGEYFAFEFEQRRGTKDLVVTEEHQEQAKPDHYRSLVWSPDARNKSGGWDEEKILKTARYICPHNGCEITDAEKPEMIQKYEERRTNLNAPKTHRSFRVNGFYGPNTRFGDIAVKFTQKGDLLTTGLQAFYNSWLALPWTTLDYNIKDEHILALKGTYPAKTLPFKPAVLLLTADPGEKLTHWTVTAVRSDGTLFLIDWGTLLSSAELLSADFLKHRIYPIEGTGEKLMPQLGYIDSGYLTETQYDICAASGGLYWPTKGSDARHGSWAETSASSRPGLKLYTYSDLQIKNELYGSRVAKRARPGLVLPIDIDGALILGLSGQQKDKDSDSWKKLPNDHYGDCIKLALLGSWIAKPLLLMLRQAEAEAAALTPPPVPDGGHPNTQENLSPPGVDQRGQ